MDTQMKLLFVLSYSFMNGVLAQCPSGWTRHEESCYHFSHDTEPWMLAQEVCKAFGGNLADITTKSEDMFLQNEVQRLKANYWVGGNDLMNEGEWKWFNTNDDLVYTNWKPGEPNSSGHNENCMDLRVVPGWNDERCDISQFYICKKSDESAAIVGEYANQPCRMSVIVVLAQCPSGWMRHDNRCYHFSHDTEPWMSAKDTCLLYGGYLADITTYSEDMFLQNMVQRLKGQHWVGGNDLMNEGEWKWVNSNYDLGYSNWLAGEPNNKDHNENCMDLREVPGWNDERCDISQFYICEKSDGGPSIFG